MTSLSRRHLLRGRWKSARLGQTEQRPLGRYRIRYLPISVRVAPNVSVSVKLAYSPPAKAVFPLLIFPVLNAHSVAAVRIAAPYRCFKLRNKRLGQ